MTWRERRKLSYLIHDFDDYRLPYEYNEEGIIDTVISFFRTESQLIYPAKSYFVAIVYARMLELYFNIPFYTALNTSDLLIEDNYFKPYTEDKMTYDSIINEVGTHIEKYEASRKTIAYFKEEFLIGTDSESNE
jgi:hypothetical protein